MATLTIRNLPDDVRDRLRVRAAQNGRSMEAEARDVLRGALGEAGARPSADEISKRVKKAQDALKPYLPKEGNIVDEFLAERRRMWGEE